MSRLSQYVCMLLMAGPLHHTHWVQPFLCVAAMQILWAQPKHLWRRAGGRVEEHQPRPAGAGHIALPAAGAPALACYRRRAAAAHAHHSALTSLCSPEALEPAKLLATLPRCLSRPRAWRGVYAVDEQPPTVRAPVLGGGNICGSYTCTVRLHVFHLAAMMI